MRHVTVEVIEDHIAILKINRPEAANALSLALLHDLKTAISEIQADQQIYCTVITGAGERAFCAGADLKERIDMNDEEVIDTVQTIGDVVSSLESMPMPVIAAINGAAFGGGLELALGCDLRIAAHHAKMGLTETSLAIIPGAGGTQRLPRLIGVGQAKRLIFTAEPIDAKEAYDIGLVEKVVHRESLLEEALAWARKIIHKGPIAIRQAKHAIFKGMETNLKAGLSIEHDCYQQTIHTEDRREGLLAFREKRQPKYKGK